MNAAQQLDTLLQTTECSLHDIRMAAKAYWCNPAVREDGEASGSQPLSFWFARFLYLTGDDPPLKMAKDSQDQIEEAINECLSAGDDAEVAASNAESAASALRTLSRDLEQALEKYNNAT